MLYKGLKNNREWRADKMDIFSLSSTTHYSPTPPPLSTSVLAVKRHRTTILSLKPPPDPPDNNLPSSTTSLRRPSTQKPHETSTTTHNTKFPKNPLKNLINPQNTPSPATPPTPQPHTLTSKLWLSSKLNPPPPPPPAKDSIFEENNENGDVGNSENSELDGHEMRKSKDFMEPGKIFVGNLPLWIKKNEVAEFFRQFGPIKNVILIKGHDDMEKNMGFGFVIYGGLTAEKAAMKAVEFDGVEFHGRVLTVKLDDGRRMKAKTEERVRWVEGKVEEGEEYRSKWHQEREGSRREFRKVLETQPENWQAVVRAFEGIKKVVYLLR